MIVIILMIFMFIVIILLIGSLRAKNKIQDLLKEDKEKYRSLFENMREKSIAANKELIAVNTLRDKLFTVITNDVREPLAVLVNLSELLVEELKDDFGDKCEIAGEIQKHARNGFSMVDNLSEWFRTKKGVEVFKPVKWELSELVQEVMQISKVKAETKCIGIISSIPDSISVYADKDMLDLVLRNLLSNAIKYTHKNGCVFIDAEEDNKMVVLSVKDTGVGIQPEKVQLLFQDVRDNATAGTEGDMGIGVGLFICRRLVQINGGDIWVDSTPGEGSSFFITIPACDRV